MLPCVVLGTMMVRLSIVLLVPVILVFVLFVVIHIGFAQEMYTYYEPRSDTVITNVTIIKEANQLTEQLYSVGVTVSSPTIGLNPATLESQTQLWDYTLGDFDVSFRQLPFESNEQEIEFIFQLFGDDIAEGTEAFQSTLLTVPDTPTFRYTTIASLSTTIRIIDDDCT